VIAIDEVLGNELFAIRIHVVGSDEVVDEDFKAIAGSKDRYIEFDQMSENAIQKKWIEVGARGYPNAVVLFKDSFLELQRLIDFDPVIIDFEF
jgi:hypothetical protein